MASSGMLFLRQWIHRASASAELRRGPATVLVSPQEQARLPADALGRGPELFQGPVLDLAHPLLADPQQVPDLPEAVRPVAGQAETQVEHLALPRPEVLHQEVEGL